MEVANLAANDNRAGIIASLALPVLGWCVASCLDLLTS